MPRRYLVERGLDHLRCELIELGHELNRQRCRTVKLKRAILERASDELNRPRSAKGERALIERASLKALVVDREAGAGESISGVLQHGWFFSLSTSRRSVGGLVTLSASKGDNGSLKSPLLRRDSMRIHPGNRQVPKHRKLFGRGQLAPFFAILAFRLAARELTKCDARSPEPLCHL